MASAKLEVVFIFDDAGEPLTGLTPTFAVYKDDTGSDVAQPAITEVGGGAYKFTPVFPTDKGLVYILDTDGGFPAYLARYMRPEDYLDQALSDASLSRKFLFSQQELGADGHLVHIDPDDSSELAEFILRDAADAATTGPIVRKKEIVP